MMLKLSIQTTITQNLARISEYQIMTETKRQIIKHGMTYPSPWIHITVTYKHDIG